MNLTIEEKSREYTKTKAGLRLGSSSDFPDCSVRPTQGLPILETDKNPLLVTALCLLATSHMSSVLILK